MDTAYAQARPAVPPGPARSLATVISVSTRGWAVADCGLKALGMDHGNPSIDDGRRCWFCSDEHITFGPEGTIQVGDRVRVPGPHRPDRRLPRAPARRRGDEVVESCEVDLRGSVSVPTELPGRPRARPCSAHRRSAPCCRSRPPAGVAEPARRTRRRSRRSRRASDPCGAVSRR